METIEQTATREETSQERACFRLWIYALGILSDIKQLKKAVNPDAEIKLNPRAYIEDIFGELVELRRELVNLEGSLESN